MDWIHGELWLCPDGLLRRSLGLSATIRHAIFPTVRPGDWKTSSFSTEEIEGIVARGRTNHWVPWKTIASARLGHARLDLRLDNGRSLTLMWVPVDDVTPLRVRLPETLAGRIRTD
jgi:hypothetical protein